MQRTAEESIVDTASHERLLFPAWADPGRRRAVQRRKRLLLLCVALVVSTIVSVKAFRFLSKFRRSDSDAVLGKPLDRQVVSSLGLPTNSHLDRRVIYSSLNPWRGAGKRLRTDILSSVSGCGGNHRPSLRIGDSASLYYDVRDSNGSTDATLNGVAVDVVIGTGQVQRDLETSLLGLCAGETIAFQSDGSSLIVHIARVGAVHREDQEARVLEKLAEFLQAIPATRNHACRKTCRSSGLACSVRGFRIINSCPRLRLAFNCRTCETAAAGSSGPDMPCYVEVSAPVGHPRGSCMVNPKVQTASCEAKYMHTRRLCPCVPHQWLEEQNFRHLPQDEK